MRDIGGLFKLRFLVITPNFTTVSIVFIFCSKQEDPFVILEMVPLQIMYLFKR